MPQETNQNQDPTLRQPPGEGGPDRITQENQRVARLNAENERRRAALPPLTPPPRRKSALKKALPYLIAGGTTGIGIGAVLADFFT